MLRARNGPPGDSNVYLLKLTRPLNVRHASLQPGLVQSGHWGTVTPQ